MDKDFIVEWRILVSAATPEQAAETAAAILFDQSQEFLTLKVNTRTVELINGVCVSNSSKIQTKQQWEISD